MSNRSERGQILIIGAAAMVVLIGIAGLVIDLGFSWMLRRAEQNAVDPATVAAARYIPAGDLGAMEEAACFYARANDFFPSATSNDVSTSSGCVPSNDPNGALLTVNWPPASGLYAGNLGYVEVILDSSHATFFSRVFGWDVMNVSSNAVAANVHSSAGVGQLVALDPTSCRAGQVRGNGVVDVEGNVYVNSDGSGPPACPGPLDDQCSGGNGGFAFSGGNALLYTPHISVRGACGQSSNPFPAYCPIDVACELNEGAPQITDPFNLPTPNIGAFPGPSGLTSTGAAMDLSNCDGPTDTGCALANGNCGTWCELNPGVYYGGLMITRAVYLHPGFYYFAGGGIQVTGPSDAGLFTIGPSGVVPGGTDIGEGRILLYGTDGPNCPSPAPTDPLDPNYRLCQGTMNLAGQGGFMAKAYEGYGPSDPWHRILIWQAEGTSRTLPLDADLANDTVRIVGQGNLDFWGTIYAPKSLVAVVGNGSGVGDVAGVQILAWQFDIGGNGNLEMPYDPDELSPILNKGLVQ